MTDRPLALVTGARKGIGRAIAVALAEAGYRVAVTSRPVAARPGVSTERTPDQTVQAIEAAGSTGLAVPLDLADRTSIDAAIDQVRSWGGRIDVLVNNAIAQPDRGQTLLADLDVEALEQVFIGQVVNTAYLTTRVVIPQLDQGPQTVVDIGSAAGEYRPQRPLGRGGVAFSYAASKAALHRLAACVHVELGRADVRAFTVNPGVVATEALAERVGAIPGAASPEAIARVIRWLVTDPAADSHRGAYLDAQELYAELWPDEAVTAKPRTN